MNGSRPFQNMLSPQAHPGYTAEYPAAEYALPVSSGVRPPWRWEEGQVAFTIPSNSKTVWRHCCYIMHFSIKSPWELDAPSFLKIHVDFLLQWAQVYHEEHSGSKVLVRVPENNHFSRSPTPTQVKTKRKKKVPTGILCRPAKTPKENNWGKSSYTTSDIWQSRKSKGTQLHFHIFVCACRALAFTVVCAIPFTSCSSGDESTEIEDRWVVFRGCVGGGARKSKLCMASLWWRN